VRVRRPADGRAAVHRLRLRASTDDAATPGRGRRAPPVRRGLRAPRPQGVHLLPCAPRALGAYSTVATGILQVHRVCFRRLMQASPLPAPPVPPAGTLAHRGCCHGGLHLLPSSGEVAAAGTGYVLHQQATSRAPNAPSTAARRQLLAARCAALGGLPGTLCWRWRRPAADVVRDRRAVGKRFVQPGTDRYRAWPTTRRYAILAGYCDTWHRLSACGLHQRRSCDIYVAKLAAAPAATAVSAKTLSGALPAIWRPRALTPWGTCCWRGPTPARR
jgi:hypothetical protein